MGNEFIENAWPLHVPDRLLDGPFLFFDILQTIGKIKEEDATGNNLTLEKGGLLTLHKSVEHTLCAKEESVILLTIAVCLVDPI